KSIGGVVRTTTTTTTITTARVADGGATVTRMTILTTPHRAGGVTRGTTTTRTTTGSSDEVPAGRHLLELAPLGDLLEQYRRSPDFVERVVQGHRGEPDHVRHPEVGHHSAALQHLADPVRLRVHDRDMPTATVILARRADPIPEVR